MYHMYSVEVVLRCINGFRAVGGQPMVTKCEREGWNATLPTECEGEFKNTLIKMYMLQTRQQ